MVIRSTDLADSLDMEEGELLETLEGEGFAIDAESGEIVVDDGNAERFEWLTGLHASQTML